MTVPLESQINKFLDVTFGAEKFAPKLSFAELKKVFTKFNNLFTEKGIKIIAIAGTNGKGETAHSTQFLCQQRGIQSLMWTSPHILSVNERFQSHQGQISDAELWKQFVQAKRELGDQLACLSYYEFLFYVFCTWASELRPEVLILEVGVGGRLDAINVLEPSLCLLTSIGRDHVELLGHSYQEILTEKLGITRVGVPCLSALRSNYCRELAAEYCDERKIPWKDLFHLQEDFSQWPYYRRNHLLAFIGLDVLKHSAINVEKLLSEFRQITFPTFQARREQMTLGNKSFIFVGAHNVEGMRELTVLLREDKSEENSQACGLRWNPKCMLVSFSKRPPSEIYDMLDQLLCVDSLERIVVSSFEHTKAYIRTELEAIVKEYKGTIIEWCENWQHWIESENQNATVVVVGSYYFIGKIQEFIQTH